jgi:hypothetical protein
MQTDIVALFKDAFTKHQLYQCLDVKLTQLRHLHDLCRARFRAEAAACFELVMRRPPTPVELDNVEFDTMDMDMVATEHFNRQVASLTFGVDEAELPIELLGVAPGDFPIEPQDLPVELFDTSDWPSVVPVFVVHAADRRGRPLVLISADAVTNNEIIRRTVVQFLCGSAFEILYGTTSDLVAVAKTAASEATSRLLAAVQPDTRQKIERAIEKLDYVRCVMWMTNEDLFNNGVSFKLLLPNERSAQDVNDMLESTLQLLPKLATKRIERYYTDGQGRRINFERKPTVRALFTKLRNNIKAASEATKEAADAVQAEQTVRI